MKSAHLIALCLVATALSASLPALTAFADNSGESITQIAMNAQQKQTLVNYLQKRLARHQNMSLDQITQDLKNTADYNRALAAKRGGMDLTKWDAAVAQSITQIQAVGDKDTVIAFETTQLQQVMTSGNYLFAVTQALWNDGCVNGSTPAWDCWGLNPVFGAFFSIFTVPIDLVIFPFELIASIATGF